MLGGGRTSGQPNVVETRRYNFFPGRYMTRAAIYTYNIGVALFGQNASISLEHPTHATIEVVALSGEIFSE